MIKRLYLLRTSDDSKFVMKLISIDVLRRTDSNNARLCCACRNRREKFETLEYSADNYNQSIRTVAPQAEPLVIPTPNIRNYSLNSWNLMHRRQSIMLTEMQPLNQSNEHAKCLRITNRKRASAMSSD